MLEIIKHNHEMYLKNGLILANMLTKKLITSIVRIHIKVV